MRDLRATTHIRDCEFSRRLLQKEAAALAADDAPLFITWRLHGSLPRTVHAESRSSSPGQNFVRLDRLLDAAAFGPVWLREPRIASIVVEALSYCEHELALYRLRAWVLMPNHVHIVVFPSAPLWRITKAIKGFTATQANQLLGRSGQPFWQSESFDHWIRKRDELERIVRYVESNPVTAGLAPTEDDWPWSSAAGLSTRKST